MRGQALMGSMVLSFAGLIATTSVAAAQTGTVYVNRESGFVNALSAVDIAIDGKVVGAVGDGACIALKVPAGRRVIGGPSFFFGFIREPATINVPAGGVVYVIAVPKVEFPGPVHWTAMVPTAKGRRC